MTTSPRPHVRLQVLALSVALCPCAIRSVHASDIEPITIAGRVISHETEKSIAGAEVFVRTRAAGGPDLSVHESKTSTDADGRYAIAVTGESEDRPRRIFWLSVRHPDYIGLRSVSLPLGRVALDKTRGKPPYFATIRMESGVEYTATVLRPDGSPANDVAYSFWCPCPELVQPWSSRDFTGKSDPDGRIRLRMFSAKSLSAAFLPTDLADENVEWGAKPAAGVRPETLPAIPLDLGQIILKPGVEIFGNAIGVDDKPIAGLRVELTSEATEVRRSATTDGLGQFRFAPVAADLAYQIGGEGQSSDWIFHWDGLVPAETSRNTKRVRLPKPGPVELRELPSVPITAQFVDTRGRPCQGGFVTVHGHLPVPEIQRQAVALGDEQAADPHENRLWSIHVAPDVNGRVNCLVPIELKNAKLRINRNALADDLRLVRIRMKEGEPATANVEVPFVPKEATHSRIELISCKTATVMVKLEREDGNSIANDPSITAFWSLPNGRFLSTSLQAVRQTDGRWRLDGVMPDEDVEVQPHVPHFIPTQLELVRIPEQGMQEVTITVTKPPDRPKIGDLAPPLLVTTLDGRARSIADYQGKYLLLHIWARGTSDSDLETLKQLYKRFGEDGKLAILGLSLDLTTDGLREFVATHELRWPQAHVRQRLNYLFASFGLEGGTPSTILIGPDGTILARNLRGDVIKPEIAKYLD